MTSLKNEIENALKIIPLSTVIFYVAGFFIWNIFLFGLKFNEIEILQSRFIYSGFFFFVYISIFVLIIHIICRYILPIHLKVSWFKNGEMSIQRIVLVMIFFILIISSYSVFIFPSIPRMFGGGRPLGLSLMPNKTSLTLDDMGTLGIPKGEGSDIQTAGLCAAYENSSIILVLLANRVVQFNKSQLNGIVGLPGKDINKYEKETCGGLARIWVRSGLGL